MRVCAWGYETPDMAQGYPYTYMSNAQAIGLMDGVDMVANTDALRGEDAQVIYNALFADYARGAKLVNTTHGTSVEQYPTLAESVWGLERAAVGVWQKDDRDDATMELTTCKAHTWVITGKSIEVGNVDMFEAYPIEDDETYLYKDGNKGYQYLFTYNGDMENIADLKGYQVELWGMGAHDEPELETVTDENGNSTKAYVYSSEWDINAIKTVKGQTAYDYTPADEDLPDVDLDDVHGFFGGTAFKGENLKWGDKAPLDEDDVKDAMQTKNSASYRVVDWDSDGAADFIVGDIYDYYKVDAVTNKTVRLVGMNDEKFVLDKDGETDVKIGEQDYTITAEFPDDLEEGDIIQVSKSDVVGKKKIASTWTIEVVEAETKELTKVDTKKGAYFDDELIHDAEYYNDVRYYFEENDRKIDGLDVYDDLNETSVDNWDLYRDANGFIIDMAESDEAWAGYIYVTGAANGRDKTGSKRQYAEISGVNDKNEMVKNAVLVKDAVVEINGSDKLANGDKVFDDYAFDKDANPKGRVFHYAVNEDGEITKMIELATEKGSEDYNYTDKTDSANIDTNKDGTLDYRYWLDEADVIFAVKTTTDEFIKGNVYNDDASIEDVNVASEYAVNREDMDAGNVIAVSVDEIPDIDAVKDADTKTLAAGIRYDDDVNKDEQSAVVLGVNTLRYFSHTSVEAGLLTNMTYNKKDDTYTATAYIAGRDGDEFTTIDADDVTINGTTKLDELYDTLTKKEGKNGIYCEFEFNKDGEITALSPMDKVNEKGARMTNADGIQINTISDKDIPATYEVSRVVVNKVTSDKALTVSGAQATAENNKVYSVENGQYVGAYDIDDTTAYYKITDEKVNLPADKQFLNPYVDGFKDDYSVEEGSLEELDSYIRNYSDKYDDEYVVADVVLDGEDVVAVYYYDELVGEYGYLTGTLSVTDKAYNEQPATATVTCTSAELDKDSVYLEIKQGDQLIATVEDVTLDVAKNLPQLPVGDYTVTAFGTNVAANDVQQIGEAQKLSITKVARAAGIHFVTDESHNNFKTDAYIEGTKTIFVWIDGLEGQEVADLTADDFIVGTANTENLGVKSVTAHNNGNVELTLENGLRCDEGKETGEVRVTLVETPNYSAVEVTHGVAATPAALPNITAANATTGGNTIVVTIAGDDVTSFMDPDMWTATWNGTSYDVTDVTIDKSNNTLTLTVGDGWTTAAGTATVIYGTGADTVTKTVTIK